MKTVVLRDDIRVLTDTVHVLPAEIVPVAVVARVWLLPDTVQQILDAMPGYVAGVHRVELLEPAADMATQPARVPLGIDSCLFP